MSAKPMDDVSRLNQLISFAKHELLNFLDRQDLSKFDDQLQSTDPAAQAAMQRFLKVGDELQKVFEELEPFGPFTDEPFDCESDDSDSDDSDDDDSDG